MDIQAEPTPMSEIVEAMLRRFAPWFFEPAPLPDQIELPLEERAS